MESGRERRDESRYARPRRQHADASANGPFHPLRRAAAGRRRPAGAAGRRAGRARRRRLPSTPPAAAPSQRFPAAAEVVALDIVVRDKKGKMVTDLLPEDVTVLEDGVPQKLTAFRRAVESAPSAGGATTVPPRRHASRRSHPPRLPRPPRPHRRVRRRRRRPAPRSARLRPPRLERSTTRAGRGRGVRQEVRDATDCRERGTHRRRHRPAARPLVGPRRRARGRAQGDGPRRRRAEPARRPRRGRQQLLAGSRWALRGRRRRAEPVAVG